MTKGKKKNSCDYPDGNGMRGFVFVGKHLEPHTGKHIGWRKQKLGEGILTRYRYVAQAKPINVNHT